jgi:hypothetical protein
VSSSAVIGVYGNVLVEPATQGSVRIIATTASNQPTVITIKRRDNQRLTAQTLANANAEAVSGNDVLVIADAAPRLGGITYYDVTYTVDAIDHSATIDITMPFPSSPAGCYPVVVNDPVNPGLEAVGTWSYGSQDQTLTARGVVFDVIGRPDRVAVGGVRSSASGSFEVLTHTANEAEALRAILSSGRVVLVRIPEEADPEHAMFYAQIGDVSISRVIPDVRRPERRWVLPYAVAAEPDVAQMTKVGNSWQEVKDGNATWQVLLDRGMTWLQALNDPSAV